MDTTFALHVAGAELDPDALDPSQIVSGAPEVAARVLWRSADGTQERGIWQCTPGAFRDVEADEMFVVLEGRATVGLEDGSELRLGPGDVGILRAGERTLWTVHETLRKVYSTAGA